MNKLYPDHPTCTGTTNALLYAWARNAKKIDLPEGVGFQVGGQTAKKYLVVQVHYMNMDQDYDSSGVQVTLFFKWPTPASFSFIFKQTINCYNKSM